MYEYMSPYLVLLPILEFFLDQLAIQPYGPDSNITKLLAKLLTSLLYFIIMPIVLCILVSINVIIFIIQY